jgi:glutathione synthase/RimK-type ligase-like ATP-grasp enzyme
LLQQALLHTFVKSIVIFLIGDIIICKTQEKLVAARLLFTNAGNAPSNNLARSMRAGADSPFIVGCNDDQFALKKSDADRNYVIPPADHPEWSEVLRWIVKTERLDLIIPTIDADVEHLSRARKKLGEYLFLPSTSVLDLCRDKYRLIAMLRRNGIDAPESYPVRDLKQVTKIFQQLKGGRPLWCRVRSGAGALGALPVRTPEQARSWIRYWKEMRGVPVTAFVLSEYLPGRDFGCQSVWKDGKLVLIKTYERLSYIGMGSQPAQVSSVAALAKTVVESKVVDTCVRAIKLLDAKVSGVFSVDLKEDARGIPCVTEIGVGRFSSATNIFDLVGKHNMAKTFVQLARGAPVKIEDSYDAVLDWYMLRDLDGPPRIFHASQFSDNIVNTWQGAASGRGRLKATERGKSGWRTFKSTRR